jgi:hypothetical protein
MNIHIYVPQQYDKYGLELVVDCLIGYDQFLNRKSDYQNNLNFVIEDTQCNDSRFIKIAYLDMPGNTDIVDTDEFDLVLLNNEFHPVEVGTPALAKMLEAHNAYLLSGSNFDQHHFLFNKILPFNHMHWAMLEYYINPWYPQYYEAKSNVVKEKDIVFINGQNRSVRQYLHDCIQNKLQDKITYHSKWNNIRKTKDSFFESSEDSTFRDFVNEKYNVDYSTTQGNNYNDNNVSIGLESRQGSVPIGYFFIDDYFKHRCIVFPETSWINHEHFMSEKIVKCFIAKALPFPVGGAGIYSRYTEFGYYTAWNLLPDALQCLDNEIDHCKRYNMIADAILWLHKNNYVLQSDSAQHMIQSNLFRCMTPHDHTRNAVAKLYNLLDDKRK